MEIINNAKNGEITAIIGKTIINYKVLPNFEKSSLTVLDYFNDICEKEKLIKALPVLELNENVFALKVSDLTSSLKNKLAVIESLVSKDDTFVFDNIHKSLTYREKENVKRILKKLAEHNKKVILLTNDIEFLFGLTKNVFICNNGEIINLTPIDWFNENVYKFVSKPPIIDFVANCKKRGIKIDNCYETKELLKAIYRSVDK